VSKTGPILVFDLCRTKKGKFEKDFIKMGARGMLRIFLI